MQNLNLISRGLLFMFFVSFFTLGSVAQDENKLKVTPDKPVKEMDMKGVKVVQHGDDSTVITIRHHDMSKMQCPFGCRKGRYNGHWAGIDFGWNGYVNSKFNSDFPAGQAYLDLNTARSLTVNINPFELNLTLVKKHLGFTSGLGFTFNNYYLSNSALLIHDSAALVAFHIVDKNGDAAAMKVNKLTVMWITLPLLFEFQTNSDIKWNSFHISAGVIGGVRVCSYTKQKFTTRDATYFLQDDNNNTVGSVYVDERFTLTHNQFHLNPFKLDGTVRIGWSFLNFFATYSITPMFQKNKGPELYPWTVGITLIGW